MGFNHKCFIGGQKEECVYCKEGLGTGHKSGVVVLMCKSSMFHLIIVGGHLIHQRCFLANLNFSDKTKCPICGKVEDS